MEGGVVEEIKNFITVWILAFATSTFCYFVIKQIPKGLLRFISIIPIVCFFVYIPLTFSCLHFIVIWFFVFTWLGSFKLLLFAFNKGPIGDPSLPLQHFIILSCLPISINTSKNPSNGLKSPLNYITKTVLLVLIIKYYAYQHFVREKLIVPIVKSYAYQHFVHEKLISALLGCHLYLIEEILLAMAAYPARAMFGFEIEPQFDDPYLSTSLQDFWGYRWNLMAPAILRPSVYLPIRTLCTPPLGHKLALVVAVFGAFIVSGLMHELLFYYVTRVTPTWEVMSFFLIHAVCLVVEGLGKRAVGDRRWLHPVVQRVLTIVFIMVTGLWLLLPPLERNGAIQKIINEYAVLRHLVKEVMAKVVPLR